MLRAHGRSVGASESCSGCSAGCLSRQLVSPASCHPCCLPLAEASVLQSCAPVLLELRQLCAPRADAAVCSSSVGVCVGLSFLGEVSFIPTLRVTLPAGCSGVAGAAVASDLCALCAWWFWCWCCRRPFRLRRAGLCCGAGSSYAARPTVLVGVMCVEATTHPLAVIVFSASSRIRGCLPVAERTPHTIACVWRMACRSWRM